MIDAYELHPYFAPCPRGVEELLADELRDCGARSVRPLHAGVSFAAKLESAYRALLWSRTASRILYSLGEIDAHTSDALYDAIRSMPWEEHMAADGTLAVDATGVNDALRNTQFTAVRVKDAICDRFRDRTGTTRPSVDTTDPDLRVNIVIRGTRAILSLDLSGEALHRRGYRGKESGPAPMKESLAAAMLLYAGWPKLARVGAAFLDPLCGSGTLVIEAAMMAGDRAPGIQRARWGFDRWLGHDEALWDRLIEEADARAEAGRKHLETLSIAGSDIDPAAVKRAQDNAKRAGLAGCVSLAVESVEEVRPSGKKDQAAVGDEPKTARAGRAGSSEVEEPKGLVACNPPYGERLQEQSSLPVLYAKMGTVLRARFTGWDAAVISPDPGISGGLGLREASRKVFYNGRIESPVHLYRIGDVDTHAVSVDIKGTDDVLELSDAGSQAFVNRLQKMAAHYGKWARRSGVSCYRVYDADLPDYNVAIDLYQGAKGDKGRSWLVISEYAPPKTVDAQTAARRLSDILLAAPHVLNVDSRRTFVKRRQQAKGGSQYAKEKPLRKASRERSDIARKSSFSTGVIEESGLLFAVDFDSYLDTGIFLDQRKTRELIRAQAHDKRFLNLFAYTGTASVFAAAGGAFETTTVDLSQTYLDWTARNFKLNGLTTIQTEAGAAPPKSRQDTNLLMRADVVQWVSEQRRTTNRWDLVLCDPPTFSNSAKMRGTWDVQRDHVELLIGVSRLLTQKGTALFSCNKRGFKLDRDKLASFGVGAKDITNETISPDFERRGGGHVCFRIWRESSDR